MTSDYYFVGEWPKDWPEDARTGPKFVQELLRRFPQQTRLVSLAEAFEELCRQEKEQKAHEH